MWREKITSAGGFCRAHRLNRSNPTPAEVQMLSAVLASTMSTDGVMFVNLLIGSCVGLSDEISALQDIGRALVRP